MWRAALLALGVLAAPVAVSAQGAAPEGILILDQEVLFSASDYGQRFQAELDAASQALANENRRIEADLTAEELELTEARETLPRAEFLELAEAFDIRVEAVRAEQEAKGRALNTAAETGRQRFFELAVPVLLELVQARGAAAILDSRAVLLSSENVDITEAALRAINAELGAGGAAPLVDLTPEPGEDGTAPEN